MDFGGFILFALLALGLFVGGLIVAAAFLSRSSQRWRVLGLWVVGLAALLVLGRWLYQVYWLDERLFIAASHGDRARVEALLAAGASPDATWEDGTSAFSAGAPAATRPSWRSCDGLARLNRLQRSAASDGEFGGRLGIEGTAALKLIGISIGLRGSPREGENCHPSLNTARTRRKPFLD